jgi:hypothetical protein
MRSYGALQSHEVMESEQSRVESQEVVESCSALCKKPVFFVCFVPFVVDPSEFFVAFGTPGGRPLAS